MSEHVDEDTTKKVNSMPKLRHLSWVWRIWRERGGLIAILFFLTLLSSAVAVTYPYLSKLLLDLLQRLLESKTGLDDSRKEVGRLVGLFLAVGGAGFVASLFPGVRGAVNVVFEHLIRKKFFALILKKDHRFFSAFRSGDVVTRLTDDIYDFPKLGWFLCSGIFRAVESISKVAFCLVAMFLLDWRLTLLSLIPVPLTIVIFVIVQDRIYDTFRKNQEAISDINAQLEMSFSGVRIIKAYACEGKYKRFFSDALARRYGTEMSVAKLGTLIDLIYMYIDYIAQIGIVFAGGWMAVKGDITIGTFYAFYNYLGMLIYPILDIPQLFVSGKRAFVNIDRLEEMKAFPDPPERVSAVELREMGAIEAKKLSFRYEGRENPAISGLSFCLAKGERLAVIGPVGSGKTTLVKAMAGLLEPEEGEIRIDGIPLSSLEEGRFTELLGYVPQEPLLFSGTIRENVAFGAQGDGREMPDEEFKEAVELAQLSEEIASFVDGEKTLLGQRGVSLSGGQKQRLAIARALARQPRLLLLDDITASLDAANEERLWRALGLRHAGLSCVVVSHRLSTLQYADKVLLLDGGKALAFGRHEELLESNEAYRAFIEEHLSLASA